MRSASGYIGAVAQRVGALVGIGDAGLRIWDIAKWPVIALLVGLAYAILC
ncbi:hypothetical protein V5P93_004273 [Actinokineospora auranticolor]|uniref:Uncharacterized protein n=1 Tax=Actinokineospora auranticolor TaxID=155976 RepID=A0A2S6GIC6_9PSEU|nr:hypothetical protein [Actinokineospora auranticolor]PPK64982.1 hypothetical protein CLV40_11624 [Actinokineospora auranticolor]